MDFRIEQLKLLRKAIIETEDKILQAVYEDLHRPKFDAYITETGACYEHISHTLGNLKKWAHPEKVKGPRSFFFSTGKIIYEPYGISLIIGPWNYPFALAICPLIAAISAGNCAVVKPSEVSSYTAQVIEEMISKYFKPEYVAVMQGDAAFTGELLKEKFDYIFFTGGTKVGKIIMEAAAKNLTPLTLELGGKSPCLVDKSADVEKAAKRITWGKFLNAGQTCVAPDYLLVHKDVKDKIISAIRDKIRAFYSEDIKKSDGFARIINKNHFQRLSAYLKEGKIILGGNTDEQELFIEPTLIENISENAKIMQEEIFGPILPILEYSEINEVIEFINNRPKPLALYIFSENKKFQDEIINKTSSGGVCINDTIMHLSARDLPFGGVGDSGFGRYHGKAGFTAFSNQKSILHQTTLFDIPHRFPPYKEIDFKIIKRLVK